MDEGVTGTRHLKFVTFPFWLPQLALGDEYASPGYFLPYPYAGGAAGSMVIDPSPGEARTLASRVLLEDSYDFEGVNRARGHLLLGSTSRLGLQAGWTYMTEELAGGGTDALSIVKAQPFFRLAQHPKVQMRAGLGGQWMVDEAGAVGGWSFSYGADFFYQEPLVVSAKLELGQLGSAGTWGWRVTAGAMLSRLELFAGYDSMSIGPVTIRGPVAGLRSWF